MRGNDVGIAPLFLKGKADTHRGLDLGNRVPHDVVDAAGTAEQVQHN